MEERYFVFQHSFAAISDLEDYRIDELFNTTTSRLEHPLLGNLCLFKIDQDTEGLNYGYLIVDQDLEPNKINSFLSMQPVKFPKAEYLYTLHRGSFATIGNTYQQIEQSLADESLEAIYHPVLIFPKGIPKQTTDETIIEVWTATNADYEAEDRRSEDILEALPRTTYNFYTW